MSDSSYMSQSKDREATLEEASEPTEGFQQHKNTQDYSTSSSTCCRQRAYLSEHVPGSAVTAAALQLEWWLLHNCVVTEISPHRTVDPFYEAESVLIKVPLYVQ